MITGSHNPSEFNGFKISNGLHSLYGESIQELRRLIDSDDFELGSGKLSKENVLEDYIQGIFDRVKVSRSVKVVVDGGKRERSLESGLMVMRIESVSLTRMGKFFGEISF